MCQSAPHRVPQAQPFGALEDAPFLEFFAGDEIGLITRDAALRTGAHTASLVVWNTTEGRLDTIGAWGTAPDDGGRSMPAGEHGFIGRVLDSGRTSSEPIAVEQNPGLAAVAGARVGYAVGASVRPPGGPPGALCVGLPCMPLDLAVTSWVVESYARLAALCLHDAGMLDGLLAAARLDALTGCLNYAATRHQLQREIGNCARHGRSLACCFLDLDHFKQVNEDHGHRDGSRLLAEVAAVLRASVRIGDSVGRYGGDEFIVLLPDTDGAAAEALAERLRSMIHATTTTAGREPLNASVGIALWQRGRTADDLLIAADNALRSAKRAGGGMVRPGCTKLVGASDVAVGAGRDVAGVLDAGVGRS